MVNVGIVLLILLAVTLSIIVVVSLISAAIASTKDSGGGGTGANFLPPCSQSIDISTLIQIPSPGPNCIQNGSTGSKYYIGKLGNNQYDYVVAPWGTQPFDVCIGFCQTYSNGVCTGPNYNGKSAQDNFNDCMSQLSTTKCSPPLPIAAQGTILYYAYSPTCNICDGCGEIP
jgi:hypothetical protein